MSLLVTFIAIFLDLAWLGRSGLPSAYGRYSAARDILITHFLITLFVQTIFSRVL
jgi:hypothetical protein